MQWMTVTSLVPCHALHVPQHVAVSLSEPLNQMISDIGKQNSPRCDAAFCGVPSGAILFALRTFIEK